MSSEYFRRTSLYLDTFKIFEWIKLLRRLLHQIQGKWGSRNFITTSRANSLPLLMQQCRDESEIYNYQWIPLSNNEFINLNLGGYAWPGLNVSRVLFNSERGQCRACFVFHFLLLIWSSTPEKILKLLHTVVKLEFIDLFFDLPRLLHMKTEIMVINIS